MQSLPSVASGAWIVFIKISATKELRLDGMLAPFFLFSFPSLLSNVRDLYCWWELRFHFPWPHSDAGCTAASLPFQIFMPKVSQRRNFRSEAWVWCWSVEDTRWGFFRMKAYIFLPECVRNGKPFPQSQPPTGVIIKCIVFMVKIWPEVCMPVLNLWANNILFQEILSGLVTPRFCSDLFW